jgi:hypothetical protein
MIYGRSIPVDKSLLKHRPQAGTHPFIRADVGKGFASEVVNEEHDIGFIYERQSFPVL